VARKDCEDEMALLTRESAEEVAFDKLLKYAGGLDVLGEAVRLATEKAGGTPDLDELLDAIKKVRQERSALPAA
jgi:hypothetical protein